MAFLDELSNDIWNATGFQEDFSFAESTYLLSQIRLSDSERSEQILSDGVYARLIQSATVFAESSHEVLHEAAQRISSMLLGLARLENRDIEDSYSLIQSKLLNFPAVKFATGTFEPPEVLPLSTQFEFIAAKADQTVEFGGDDLILTPFQMQAWKSLFAGQTTALSAPTSAGKSFVLVKYIVERLRSTDIKTIVYVVPTRALITQVANDLQEEVMKLGLEGVSFTTAPVDISTDTGTQSVYVLTQERLEVLLLATPSLKPDLVVIDEAQAISRDDRGVRLESVIDRVLERSPLAQFVFSGPMLANPSFFEDIFSLPGYQTCSTKQPTVTQNLIYLKYLQLPSSAVEIRLSSEPDSPLVAAISLPAKLSSDEDILSYLSSYFGKSGSSIVYASGRANAEHLAIKIAQEIPGSDEVLADLQDLIDFVRKHVHRDYALVNTLRKGVAFHYGHMPSLLRKELEAHFSSRKISFLACTSTLLYGLNLPAKNLFLLKPTTGRGSAIDGPDFWNLAGRAGRLGKELDGNVFLIDYGSWGSQPVSEQKGATVTSALQSAIVDQANLLLDFLDDNGESSGVHSHLEIAAGKLVLDYRQDRLSNTLARYRTPENADKLKDVEARVAITSDVINVPTEVLDANISVSVFRQQDLLDYFVRRANEIDVRDLIPADPMGPFQDVQINYRRAFKRIHTYLLKYPGRNKSEFFFAPLALRWMRGDALPVLIDNAIAYNKTKRTNKSTAAIIRETMEHIESDLRFKYVKYFTSYRALLRVALARTGHSEFVNSIPDVSLFLEMGGSSGAMINLMALGLSRTSAESLVGFVNNKDATVSELREWLVTHDFEQYDISRICLREIVNLTSAVRQSL